VTIHTGRSYPSHLLLPVVPPKERRDPLNEAPDG
jgi:hypothetical protein